MTVTTRHRNDPENEPVCLYNNIKKTIIPVKENKNGTISHLNILSSNGQICSAPIGDFNFICILNFTARHVQKKNNRNVYNTNRICTHEA